MVGNFTSYRERVCWPHCTCKIEVWEGIVTSIWKEGNKILKTAAIKKEMYDQDTVKRQVRQTLRDCG